MKPNMMTKTVAETLGVSQPNTLTPTTLRNITQMLESDDCLRQIQNFDTCGELPELQQQQQQQQQHRQQEQDIPVIISGSRTFHNLDSKNWQGGITTILSPDSLSSSMVPQTILDQVRNSTSSEEEEEEKRNNLRRNPRRKTTQTMSSSSNSSSASSTSSSVSANSDVSRRRTGGGRKPNNSTKNGEELSPEEERRLQIRRERNKQAAARCRKRRVDQTNSLLEEVERQEQAKRALQDEIQQLQCQKQELEFILEAHRSVCKAISAVSSKNRRESEAEGNQKSEIKSEPVIVERADAPYLFPPQVPAAATPTTAAMTTTTTTTATFESISGDKPKRPVSLSLTTPSLTTSTTAGVSIETPSSIIPSLNFDSFLGASTGLTPLSNVATPIIFTPTLNTPTCSTQQRSAEEHDPECETPNLVAL